MCVPWLASVFRQLDAQAPPLRGCRTVPPSQPRGCLQGPSCASRGRLTLHSEPGWPAPSHAARRWGCGLRSVSGGFVLRTPACTYAHLGAVAHCTPGPRGTARHSPASHLDTHAVRACSRVAEVPLESQVQRDHCTPQCQRRWSPSPARSAGREHVTCGALAPASAGLGPVAQGAHEAAGALPLRRHARGHRHTHSPSPTQKPLHLHR